MKKSVTTILLLLVLVSCAGKRELAQSNQRIKELSDSLKITIEKFNDTDKDGVPDYLDVENNSIAGALVDSKGRMMDYNNNGIADDLEKYLNANTKDFSSIKTEEKYVVSDLYSLKPTKQKEFHHFFNNNMTLLACNAKLTAQLKKVEALKEYKYFETNGGFGIITDPKNIDGNPGQYGHEHGKSSFIGNLCSKLFGFGSATQQYQRVYIFLVIKNDMNEELTPNYDYLDKIYRNRQLESKWANIENLKVLLNNPKNKYNSQQHTFMMRVYEFKKGQLQDDDGFEFIKGDNGYRFDPKVEQLFTSKTP
jgi:hypothetical protein